MVIIERKYSIVKPNDSQIKEWVNLTLSSHKILARQLGLCIVDKKKIHILNKKYLNKDRATNVLSFPFEAPNGIKIDYLGDIFICPTIIREEAKIYNKLFNHHFCHMLVHAILHLLGFDHKNNRQEKSMQKQEIKILSKIGISNPYT